MNIILNTLNDQPVIRVNTFKNQKHVDLQFDPEDFDFYDLDGNLLFDDNKKSKWRIKVKQANQLRYEYFLILKEAENREALEEEFHSYEGVLLHHVGGQIIVDDKKVTTNDKYLLVAGPFASEREARHHSQDYAQLNHCRTFRQIAAESKGVLEIFDPNYEIFSDVKNGLRLVSKNEAAYFQIKHYAINHQDKHKVEHQDLVYQSTLKIGIDQNNTLMGINEVGVETYLKGVLHSELGDRVSLEFAKTMAIVGRSQIFARIGQMHAHEGFDFCSGGHCLRYYGRKVENKYIEQAISETKGMILSVRDRVCNAYFSYSCGGHTENASGVWLNDKIDYINGRLDTQDQQEKNYNLQSEQDVKQWILKRPEVLCKTDSQEVGGSAELASDAFRWEVFYTRNELEKIIFEKTGEELGVIYEMIPVQRGVSGRIKEIEILSSLKNIRIRGELNIRSAFSNTYLNSSCFIIEPELDMDGVPINFTFIGAGKGHGVGLCKVGAAKMSMDGTDYIQILAHYFNKCSIKRIY